MNPKQKTESRALFEKILRLSHPLCTQVVYSLVKPIPGIYLIRNPHWEPTLDPGLTELYVGRSSTNLQRRLLAHCHKREYYGKEFSFHYAKSPLEAYRLENKAILYFRESTLLTNQIRAAKPTLARE